MSTSKLRITMKDLLIIITYFVSDLNNGRALGEPLALLNRTKLVVGRCGLLSHLNRAKNARRRWGTRPQEDLRTVTTSLKSAMDWKVAATV
jgi:hypothetical protein